MSFTLLNISLSSNNTNQSNAVTKPDIEPLHTATLIFCIVVIFTGVVGNVLVLSIFGGGWVKARSCGIYLINMAIANLIGTTIIPSELILEILNYGIRPIGDVGCKIFAFLSTTSISVSSFSLVVISIDRYIVLKRPTRNAFSPLAMIFVISLIWILGGSSAIIYVMGNRIRLHHRGEISVCRTFASYDERVVHTLLTFSLQVVIPLLIMFVLYVIMVKRMKTKSANTLLQHDDDSTECFKRDKRAIRILLLIVMVFFVCQLPVNIFYLHDLFKPNMLPTAVSLRVYTILHMLQMASNCINPVIYVAFNRYLDEITAGKGDVLFIQNAAYLAE